MGSQQTAFLLSVHYSSGGHRESDLGLRARETAAAMNIEELARELRKAESQQQPCDRDT